MGSIETICNYLDCNIGDAIEFVNEKGDTDNG
jgi:DNA-binding Xre family transcriptional regulator